MSGPQPGESDNPTIYYVRVGRKTSLHCAKRLLLHISLESILIEARPARKGPVPDRPLKATVCRQRISSLGRGL